MIFSEKKEEVGSIADICLEDRTKKKIPLRGTMQRLSSV